MSLLIYTQMSPGVTLFANNIFSTIRTSSNSTVFGSDE